MMDQPDKIIRHDKVIAYINHTKESSKLLEALRNTSTEFEIIHAAGSSLDIPAIETHNAYFRGYNSARFYVRMLEDSQKRSSKFH